MTIDSGSDNQPDYQHLLGEIRQRIRSAQYQALKAVNQELIALYWDIGQLIVERQQGAGWGKAIVEHLASDIRPEFPGIAGFSARNIWRMRDFYLSYKDSPKLTPLVSEIGWIGQHVCHANDLGLPLDLSCVRNWLDWAACLPLIKCSIAYLRSCKTSSLILNKFPSSWEKLNHSCIQPKLPTLFF